MLREEFRRYLDIRAKANIPAPWDVSVAEFRNLTMPNPAFIGIPEPIHSIEHRNIAGLTGYLPIRIYRPSDEPNLPVLVYFHGGGWVIGNMDGFEPTVRSLANKAKMVVIQVQYQKAPEHPFPTPFDDCYTTLEWVVKNAATLKIDPTKIGVGGDSAGGNLAAGVAMKCRDEKLVDLAFQMLVYPCTGHDGSLPSAIANSEGSSKPWLHSLFDCLKCSEITQLRHIAGRLFSIRAGVDGDGFEPELEGLLSRSSRGIA